MHVKQVFQFPKTNPDIGFETLYTLNHLSTSVQYRALTGECLLDYQSIVNPKTWTYLSLWDFTLDMD